MKDSGCAGALTSYCYSAPSPLSPCHLCLVSPLPLLPQPIQYTYSQHVLLLLFIPLPPRQVRSPCPSGWCLQSVHCQGRCPDVVSDSLQLTQFIGVSSPLRIILSRIYMFCIRLFLLSAPPPITHDSFPSSLLYSLHSSTEVLEHAILLQASALFPVYFSLPAKSPQSPLSLLVALLFQSLIQAVSSSPIEVDSFLLLS